VWCGGDGLAIFDKFHSRACETEVILYAFDLLELDGTDWRPRTLGERKERLAELLADVPAGIRTPSTLRAMDRNLRPRQTIQF
jgi:ATP-dependent DNA ligase